MSEEELGDGRTEPWLPEDAIRLCVDPCSDDIAGDNIVFVDTGRRYGRTAAAEQFIEQARQSGHPAARMLRYSIPSRDLGAATERGHNDIEAYREHYRQLIEASVYQRAAEVVGQIDEDEAQYVSGRLDAAVWAMASLTNRQPVTSDDFASFRHVDGLPGVSERCWRDVYRHGQYVSCNAEADPESDVGLCTSCLADLRSIESGRVDEEDDREDLVALPESEDLVDLWRVPVSSEPVRYERTADNPPAVPGRVALHWPSDLD